MTTITYPKMNVKYFAIQDVYVKGDLVSVTQYCTDKGIVLDHYEVEDQRFSNDGGASYQYYGKLVGSDGTSEDAWHTEFGFAQIVKSITYV